METEVLREIGLKDEEIKIYLALLKLGPSLASAVSQKTDIERSLTYKILGNLIKKGFVSYVIKNNIRYYNPISPGKILDILKERQEKMQELIPDLNKMLQLQKEKPTVEILEGKEGIKTILNDVLKIKKDYCAIGSGKGPETLYGYADFWQKERIKHKVMMKVLFDRSELSIKRAKVFSKFKYTDVRFLDKEVTSPSSMWVYGDHVAILVWSKEHPFAIRIISEEISMTYRNYFNGLWKSAKKINP